LKIVSSGQHRATNSTYKKTDVEDEQKEMIIRDGMVEVAIIQYQWVKKHKLILITIPQKCARESQ
jgi:hypothetical protein